MINNQKLDMLESQNLQDNHVYKFLKYKFSIQMVKK